MTFRMDKKAAKADRPFTKRAPRKDGEKKPAAKKAVVKKDLADLKKSDVAEAKAE